MRQKFYFLNDLKKRYPEDYIENIKFELDNKVYHYGEQFNSYAKKTVVDKFLKTIRFNLVDLVRVIKNIFVIKKNSSYAVSGAYFGLEKHLNIQSAPMPWKGLTICSWHQYRLLRRYQNYLSNSNMIELLSSNGISRYTEIINILNDIYIRDEIKYLCIPQDMSPYEKMSVAIFKELEKKSFVFLHGLPGRYNNIDDNRADYLVVWGKKIKDLYVATGVDPDKIYISGHPGYGTYDFEKIKIRSGLDNILVLSKSMNGGQHSDGVRLSDRGNLILYLLKIEAVLKSIGVKSVRFRPHPSENIRWYYQYIDKNFFKTDNSASISQSLRSSSMVIGPTSSVFIDSLMNGVNYMVFEPSIEKIDITNYPLVPPFDKSDPRVVVSFTEDELKTSLLNRDIVEISVLSDYVQDNFDISFIGELIL